MLIFLGITIGMAIASQTAVNARLRHYVLSPFLTSLISFSIGTAFLIVAMLVFGESFALPAGIPSEPAWIWLGGLCGVIFLTVNILLFPKLGAVETTILPLLGQITMALAIDHFGWFRTESSPLTGDRLLGVGILLLGLFFAVAYSDLAKKNPRIPSNTVGSPWPWRALGLSAGLLVGVQLAANAELGRILDSQIYAAFFSFLVGTTTLLLIVAFVDRSIQGLQGLQGIKVPPWVFLGGILGAVYVLSNVFLVDALGTGRTVVAILFGQVSASLLIQFFGLFQSDKSSIPKVKILGLALMILGVALVQ